MKQTFTTYHIHQTSCIHPVFPAGPTCGKPCTAGTPHGWLCPFHEAYVNRNDEIEEVK